MGSLEMIFLMDLAISMVSNTDIFRNMYHMLFLVHKTIESDRIIAPEVMLFVTIFLLVAKPAFFSQSKWKGNSESVEASLVSFFWCFLVLGI